MKAVFWKEQNMSDYKKNTPYAIINLENTDHLGSYMK